MGHFCGFGGQCTGLGDFFGCLNLNKNLGMPDIFRGKQ